MTIVIGESAGLVDPGLARRLRAAAAAGLPLTCLKLAEGAGLSELTANQVLTGLSLAGKGVSGARRLSKERRLRKEARRREQAARAREEIAAAKRLAAERELAALKAAEREAELEHERRLAALRAGNG